MHNFLDTSGTGASLVMDTRDREAAMEHVRQVVDLPPSIVDGTFRYMTDISCWIGRPTTNDSKTWRWSEINPLEYELFLLKLARKLFPELITHPTGNFEIPDVCAGRVTGMPVWLGNYRWDDCFCNAVAASGIRMI